MSDLKALVGVFVAVDQRVLADPSLEQAVATLVCPYQFGAKGWSVAFESWLSENGWPPLPDLDTSLAELARVPMAGRTAARRLLAMAALSRVTDGFSSAPLRQAATEVLQSPAIAPSIGQADELVGLLANLRVQPRLSNWDSLLSSAAADGLISAGLAAQTQPPCAAQVCSIPGNPNPACTLETNFCTSSLTLAQAEGFLDPRNWPGCSSFWCDMTPLTGATPPAQRYLETVSLDCAIPSMNMDTVLDFLMMTLPGGQGAIVTYTRCPDQSQGGDGLVTVDEGSIEVRQVGGQVCVHTTKRVQFNYGFTAGELAMISCALGYGSMGEELVFSCAMSGGQSQYPFQGSPLPTGGGQGHDKGRVPGQTVEPIAVIIGDGVKAVGQCLEECAAAARCTQAKWQAGTYGPADTAQDLSRTGARLLRDLSVAATLSARTMRTTRAGAAPSDDGTHDKAEDR